VLDFVNGAGRKCHGKVRAEADKLFLGPGCAAHGLAPYEGAGEQTHGLEKLEFVATFEQLFF
jgi:hypothetical protein